MAHVHYSPDRAAATPAEWLPVGAAVGRLVNKWAERDDLIAYVGPGAGKGSPACYNPKLAEVEVDVALAFGYGATPEQVGDLEKRSQQYEFPNAVGSIMHEAFHARYSRYDLEEAAEHLSPAEHAALLLLEEARIEAWGVAADPSALPFIKASTMALVIGDTAEKLEAGHGNRVQTLANIVGLVHSRVDAGLLEEAEVSRVLALVDALLGAATVDRLRRIADRARAHEMHAYPEPLYDLAREWVAVLSEAAAERGEPDPAAAGEAGSPGSGDGDGGPGDGLPSELLDALREAAEEIAFANHERLADQQAAEEWAEEVKGREAAAKEASKNREEARKVFEKGTGIGPGNGTHSRLVETRQPTPQERVAAVTVAQMLEKAKYRERDETEIASVVPPGRLRTRALVQAAAMRERGVVSPVQPWRRTVRRQTDDPTLTVGVLVDISGSMRSAMGPMATTAWVLSEAVRRVQGRAAMVYYGNDVFPTLRPGEHLESVNVYSANDGTEEFERAFRALDGSLGLTDGTGARLLVIVSDGHYTAKQTEAASAIVRRCRAQGVGVLWLAFDSAPFIDRITTGTDVQVVRNIDGDTAAASIGAAAAAALSRVGLAA